MSARYRVEWLPGSDVLQGRCFCGATADAQDPATLLDWLDGHPEGHDARASRVERPTGLLVGARS